MTARPFRCLCPEADQREAMTDNDFWHHVLSQYVGLPDYEPDYDDGPPDGMGIVVISDHVSPCPLCGEWGPCGYDESGRPMIHAFYDAQDGDE